MEATALLDSMEENTRQTRNSMNKPMTETLGKGNIITAFARINTSKDKENDILILIFIDEDNQEETTETLKRRRVATPARKIPSVRASFLRSDIMPKFGSTQTSNDITI